mgnify:CR=1 FL=1
MNNSERFISAFNKIEKYLDDVIKAGDRFTSFSSSVKRAAEKNIIVRRYKDDLLEISELRNAIVHERTDPEYLIAEPHDSVVELLEKIYEELTEPKKVYPLYARDVTTFKLNDTLKDLLSVVKEASYSYFPIYNHTEFQGLVTENGITHWLASKDKNILLNEVFIKEILPFEEGKDNYAFLSSEASIYEAEEIFRNHINQNTRFDVILITENGKPTEQLLGMITAWDIIELP